MPQDSPPNYVTHDRLDESMTALEERIDRKIDSALAPIERAIGSLDRAVNKALDRSAERQTNWGWVFAGVGVLSAFIALYVTPVRSAVEELGQRLWNVETSRYSVEDGKDLRDRMEMRDDLIIAKIDENNQRAWEELASRAEWMGGAERDISENAHELDLVWAWKHGTADPMLYTQQERLEDLIRRVTDIEEEQRKRTGRVYGVPE